MMIAPFRRKMISHPESAMAPTESRFVANVGNTCAAAVGRFSASWNSPTCEDRTVDSSAVLQFLEADGMTCFSRGSAWGEK